jgi:ADP-heptose:LPS heptosyltransferase
MKIVGFNQGQIGDLVMNLVPCRAIKEKYPNSHLIFSINKKYESAAPIFYNNPLIDEIKIWDGYDNWPSEEDKLWIENNKDIDLFFNPMPKITDDFWYLKRHHTEEVCRMHGLQPPSNLKIELTKYFETNDIYHDCVAFSTFTSAGKQRDVPEDIANILVKYVHSLGFKTIQLGLKDHPKLSTTYGITGGSIFDDVKIALSCKLLITADTGMNWILSGYQAKVLGLYSTLCYPNYAPLKNRTPKNNNAIYLENSRIENIDLNIIKKSIVSLLNLYD